MRNFFTDFSKIMPIMSMALIVCVYSLFVLRPPVLVTSDIGRHLANGREIMSGNWRVVFSNTYSYTFTDEPTINHHWLSGVFFYLVQIKLGFMGLHLLHALLLAATLVAFIIYLKNISSWHVALLLALPAVLLFGTRTEIRPESFGYLGILCTLLILEKTWQKQKISRYQAVILLAVMILWVNLHISFIFGLFLLVVYLCSAFFVQQTKDASVQLHKHTLIYHYGYLLFAVCGVTLLNPNGINGSLAPLHIFVDYGYPVAENQNLWFLQQRISEPAIAVYVAMLTLAVFLAGVAFWIRASAKATVLPQIHYWMLGLTGFMLGFIALRNIPILVLFSFPLLAKLLTVILRKLRRSIAIDRPTVTAYLVNAALSLSTLLIVGAGVYNPTVSWQQVKLGNYQSEADVVSAYTAIDMPEPIFNNYDIGSALIYWLYPHRQVFVDNRPEAYTSDFFQNTYIPMQESEKIWQEQLQRNNFQAIIFGHNDQTPWAKTFLRARLADPAWKTVFADEFAVLLVRNDAE